MTATSSRTRTRPDLVAGAVGLAIMAMGLLGSSPATGSAPASDGSDWGTQGLLSSDSQVTLRWDNTANPGSSIVPRNQRQVIPHTGGDDYFDIPAGVLDAYESHFGPGAGRASGLRVSVSQTADLVNQAVTVDFAGADPDLTDDGSDSRTYFQVFQCWGAPAPGGVGADPQAGDPDPATCQVGASGSDSVGAGLKREYRVVGGDPLVPGGDWEQYDTTSSFVEVPFRAISGDESGPNLSAENTFFNRTTTNELSHVTLPASGETQRQFEVQTGTESQGLGCGQRSDQVSTPTCWLVVVPRVQGVLDDLGPTSPSVWAQRLQVQLGFRSDTAGCAAGAARSTLAGSEMLGDAAASWIPAVCQEEGVALGYTRLGDEVARNQYAGGSANAVLTTQPLPAARPAVHVPIALTAPVVAFNIDYAPTCVDESVALEEVTSESGAQECGYDSLAELRADAARAGQPIRDLRLNARLVAKLLTQSYQNSMINCGPDCRYSVTQGVMPEWTLAQPVALTDDPEFRALNPQLHLKRVTSISEPILEAARSDAANAIWRWILADTAAASFLAGCPDADGVVVNPFYSTRTYIGCSDRAAELGSAANAARADTTTPRGFVDAALVYPPDGSPFPLPNWQEEAAADERPARTLVDHLPRVDTMLVGARDAFIGYRPRNSEFCRFDVDPSCFPAPGKWKDPKTYQRPGQRELLTITDAPSAARYKLPTASMCATSDTTGTQCVGASAGSLRAAAASFVPTPVAGVRGPSYAGAYAGGAYPLTMPVYAAIKPSLGADVRGAYAEALEFISGTGQTPGYLPGNLPPGYAPLTETLRSDAAVAITTLRKADPKPSASATPSEETSEPASTESAAPSESPSGGAGGGGAAEPAAPGQPPAGEASPQGGQPAASPAPTEIQTVPVAASTESWPGWLFPVGLAITLAAGVWGPLMRRRSTLRFAPKGGADQ